MRSKTSMRKMIRKLILAGYWQEAERLLRELENDLTYYKSQDGIRRITPEPDNVVSLDEFRKDSLKPDSLEQVWK